MIDRPPHDLSDIWEDGPTAPPRQPEPPPPRQSAKPKPRQKRRPVRSRWLSILGYGGLALACLAVGAAAFLLVAAPVDLVRDRVIEQVKARTGRDLVVAGATALSLFPRPAVSLSDVSLSAPEGAGAPPTLAVPTVDAELRLWSLVAGGPAIERITLHRPTIELSVDAAGRRSWEFAGERSRSRPGAIPGDGSDQGQPSSRPSVRGEREREPPRTLPKLGAAAVRIVGGTVRYSDHRSATHTELESLYLTLAADDLSGPLKVNGTLSVRGAPMTVAATVSPMQSVLSRQPAQLALAVSGSPFEGTYQGTISLDAGIALDGALKLQAASARALADWLGRPLPAHDDAGALALSTGLKVTEGQVALSDLQASLGPSAMAGSLSLDIRQERKRVSGSLQISPIDFGKLLAKPERDRGAAAGHSASPAPAQPASPHSGEHRRDRGWNEDAINLAALGLFDANLSLSAESIIYKDVKTGPSRLSVALEGGVGKVTLEAVELYGGRGQGVLTLDGTGEALVAGTSLKLDGVALKPVLTDALEFPWLEGRGSISLALAGQGLTERQIVEGLNGKVEITSVDGAIVGLDISKIVRSLQQARLPSFTPSPNEKTPYSELAATFNVTNGVAKNHDLKLTGANLHLSGEGTLDLGPRQIDYTVRTKVGGGAPEPDATIKVGTLEVPVSIVGSWDKPTFGIKGQEQLTGALKQIRKNLKSQDVRDAIKGLLQGDGEKRVKPRDLIEKLLKKD